MDWKKVLKRLLKLAPSCCLTEEMIDRLDIDRIRAVILGNSSGFKIIYEGDFFLGLVIVNRQIYADKHDREGYVSANITADSDDATIARELLGEVIRHLRSLKRS